jgi:hypothetical protein
MQILHESENNSESQEHLNQNGKKFHGDCLTVMRLLYSGIRLSAQDVVVKYGLHDRRLRDCYAARPDVIKKEWVLKPNGRRDYVVYFIDVVKRPVKSDLQKWFMGKPLFQPSLL